METITMGYRGIIGYIMRGCIGVMKVGLLEEIPG